MIPLIVTAQNQAMDLADSFHRQAECLQKHFWQRLVEEEWIKEIEVTPQGIRMVPMHSPRALVDFFADYAKLTFSRERDENGLYQWVTSFDEFQILLWIVANENIDMTGTVVTSDFSN